MACIIVEPVAGNAHPPEPDFLQTLRSVCDERGSVLIFDEGISRVETGAQVTLTYNQI